MSARCSVCARPIDVHQRVRGGTCDDAACRAAAVKHRIARARAEHEAAQRAIARAYLPALLADGGVREVDVALLVVPASATALEPVSAARRETLRNSVAQAVAASAQPEREVAAAESPAADIAPHSAAVGATCATCRGFCCRMGGDSGYIDAGTVRRARAQTPDLGPDELVALYVDAIPERSVAGSCVFHGEQGCALPRELRSRICNTYFCPPLREWIGRAAETAARPTAVVVLDGERVVRSALIE